MKKVKLGRAAPEQRERARLRSERWRPSEGARANASGGRTHTVTVTKEGFEVLRSYHAGH